MAFVTPVVEHWLEREILNEVIFIYNQYIEKSCKW